MFEVGDIIRRPKGRNNFIIVKVMPTNHRFGRFRVRNMVSGKIYYHDMSNAILIEKATKTFILKKVKKLKF